MKKFIVLFLIYILTLPTFAKLNNSYLANIKNYDYSGVYVEEDINTPISKIGIPKEIFENQQEAGLEISWNKWHADVSNELARRINDISIEIAKELFINLLQSSENLDINSIPQNFMCLTTAKVNSDKTVEDVISIIIPRDSFDIQKSHVYVTENSKFYMYNAETKKYYRWFYHGEPIDFNVDNGNGDAKVIKKLLSNGKMLEQNYEEILFPKFLVQVANKVSGLSGKYIMEFPAKSKRKYVNIYFGTTDIIEIQTIREATEDMYNDIERHR